MICPRCGAEFREGFSRCSDCGAALTSEFSSKPLAASPSLPKGMAGMPPEIAPALELVTVFRSGDPIKIMIAESILRSAEMDFLTRGREVQSLFGVGSVGGMNIVTGPMDIQVRREDVRDAAAMLEHLEKDEFDPDVGLDWEEGAPDEGEE